MRAFEFLTEAASSVLYHYTTIDAAMNILQTNEFHLTLSTGTPSETNLRIKGKPYYMSFTRSKVGDYHRYAGNGDVMLVCDGNWFNRNGYTVRPIDYWERIWNVKGTGRTRESEDRLYSSQPMIPADSITEVHVILKDQDARVAWRLRKLVIAAIKRSIPYYLYTDEKAWRLQDKRRSVTFNQIKNLAKGKQTYSWGTSKRREFLKPWLELLQKNNKKELSDHARKELRGIIYYNYHDDYYKQLSNELSNARKPGQREYNNAIAIQTFMTKNKINTTKELVDYIKNKWEGTFNESI